MKLAVASGKGGTGKTTVAVNLALAIGEGVQFLDCDVEGANAHIFLKPQIETVKEVGVPVPRIEAEPVHRLRQVHRCLPVQCLGKDQEEGQGPAEPMPRLRSLPSGLPHGRCDHGLAPDRSDPSREGRGDCFACGGWTSGRH